MGKEAAITIDLMKKSDIEQVLAIEQASFSMPWSRNLFLSEFRSPLVSTLLVSIDKGTVRRITGYIVFWLVADEMHILNLAVSPESRRQGIARGLVGAGMMRALEKGARRAFLEVRVSNTAAQKLYSSLGFTGSGVRRDYYDSPVEDAVVMMLEEGVFKSIARHV